MSLRQSYEDWHNNPKHPHAHWATFVSVSLIATFLIINQINLTYNPDFGIGIQESEAQTLPTRILTAGDLVHQGSFTIPSMRDVNNGQYCEWTNGEIAYNPTNNSLFIVCHDWTQTVGEISIPALGGQATELQQPRDALEGRITQINPNDPNSKKVGGLWVEGNKLIVTAFSYYDGSGTANSSHFVRSTNLSAAGTLVGPFKVGTG